jgi:hypothetical protein
MARHRNNIPILEYFERGLEYIPQKQGVPLSSLAADNLHVRA